MIRTFAVHEIRKSEDCPPACGISGRCLSRERAGVSQWQSRAVGKRIPIRFPIGEKRDTPADSGFRTGWETCRSGQGMRAKPRDAGRSARKPGRKRREGNTMSAWNSRASAIPPWFWWTAVRSGNTTMRTRRSRWCWKGFRRESIRWRWSRTIPSARIQPFMCRMIISPTAGFPEAC